VARISEEKGARLFACRCTVSNASRSYLWTVRYRNSTDFLVDGMRDSRVGLSLSIAIAGLSGGSIFSSKSSRSNRLSSISYVYQPPTATLNPALYQLKITLNFTMYFLSIERGLIHTFLLVSNYWSKLRGVMALKSVRSSTL
jgi:hypothetical protein